MISTLPIGTRSALLFQKWTAMYDFELSELYAKYRQWCIEINYHKTLNFPDFCRHVFLCDRALVEPHLN